nr:zf-HC2 domain-containing protein [uncultured Kingella sp.]
MKRCRKATYLLSKRLDGAPLTRQEVLFLQTHLLMCYRCRRYKQQLAVIEQAMKEMF